jgi:hypothetical protein
MANNQFAAIGTQADIAAAAEAERHRIRTIEALGHEFGLPDVARVLSCETSETPEECRRILGLLVKAGADQKARANGGWDRAYAVANRIAGRGGPASQNLDALPGTPEKILGKGHRQSQR